MAIRTEDPEGVVADAPIAAADPVAVPLRKVPPALPAVARAATAAAAAAGRIAHRFMNA
jgi:hypothetical protein